MLRDEEVRIDVGRCTGGTFLRVIHVPTGISRSNGPLDGESSSLVRSRLLAEVESELASRGLSQYIIPTAGMRPAGRDA